MHFSKDSAHIGVVKIHCEGAARDKPSDVLKDLRQLFRTTRGDSDLACCVGNYDLRTPKNVLSIFVYDESQPS